MISVSIIITAYNIEKYISRCIDSVINQTLRNIEIIIVNDGSTDSTLRIIEEYKDIDNRIIVVNKFNQGIIEARKSGLKISNGEYLLFIDGDDWIEIDTINKLYNKAKRENSDITMYNFLWAYENGKEIDKTYKVSIDEIKDNPLRNLLLGNISPCLWGKLIKKDYLNNNRIKFPSNISFAEDLAVMSSLFMHNPKISILEEYLYNYFQREDSITKVISDKILDVDRALCFIYEELIDNDLYFKYQLEFQRAIYSHLFVHRFLSANSIGEIHIKLYYQFKKYNINIFKNIYIRKNIKKQPLSLKIRIITYNYNYKLGRIYDSIRKKIINKKYIG